MPYPFMDVPRVNGYVDGAGPVRFGFEPFIGGHDQLCPEFSSRRKFEIDISDRHHSTFLQAALSHKLHYVKSRLPFVFGRLGLHLLMQLWPSPRPGCARRKKKLRGFGTGRSASDNTAPLIVLEARRLGSAAKHDRACGALVR